MAGFSFKARKSSGWGQAVSRLKNADREHRRVQFKAVMRAALGFERELKLGIRKGAPGGKKFPPLSEFTKIMKGSSKPLIDNADLLNSIKTSLSRSTGSAFVGVHRSSRGSNGQSLVNVAVIHEFGVKPFVIPVTPKMWAFFFALHVKSGGKINFISPTKEHILHPGIEARPFIRPTLRQYAPKAEKVMAKVFKDEGII